MLHLSFISNNIIAYIYSMIHIRGYILYGLYLENFGNKEDTHDPR